MPSRHSKNKDSLGHFTYFERSIINKWGTRKTRVGADYTGFFDSCRLCVSRAIEPLVCPNGNLYCTECIYGFVLAQKQWQKKQTKLYNRYLQEVQKNTKNKGDENALSKIEKFAQLENGITTQTKSAFEIVKKRKASIHLEAPKGYKTYVLDPAKQQICHFPDTDLIKKHMVTTDKLTMELQKERSQYLPCFWIPNLTPDAGKCKINKPTGKIFCPYGKRLKLKKLTPVRFTPRPLLPKELETEEKREKYQTIYMCPMCVKTLTNSTNCYVIKRTGDVICKQCGTLIKEDGIYNGKPIKSSGLIKLNVGGTGFAARGAHTAKAIVLPAYQC